MFASKNFDAAVLDFGFLGRPLQERLFPSLAVPIYNRRRQPLLDAIQSTGAAFLRSIWKWVW
jgi:hypothetical protein